MTKAEVGKLVTEKLKTTGNATWKFVKENKNTVTAAVVSTMMTEAAMRRFRNKNTFSKICTVIAVSSGQVALMRSARKLDLKK